MLNTFKISFILLCLLSGSLIGSLSAQQFTEVAVELGVEDSTKFFGGDIHWIDFNNDNLLDLYVVNPSHFISPFRPNSNRLYMNQIPTTGKFVDVAASVNADVVIGKSSFVTWADFDSDGWIDLYVKNGPGFFGAPDVPNQLLKNNNGVFIDIAPILGIDFLRNGYTVYSVGDPDGDGDQDIYTVNHFSDKNNLLRNDGITFTDVADQWDISGHEGGIVTNGGDASWIDYNNDGMLDLFVLNGGWVPNRLYKNDLEDSGRFIDVAHEAGIDSTDFFRLVSNANWGDFDNDGDVDMFTANFTNDSGRSLLYRNDINETGVFVEISEEVGMGTPGRAVSGAWGDYDNDGDLDLYITYDAQPNRLYRNDLNISGLFVDVANIEGVDSKDIDQGAAWGDFDNDGDLDLYVTNTSSPVSTGFNLLYRNEQNDSNYLKVRPLDANGSYNRHGSRVYVYKAGTDTLVGMRDAGGGSGYFGSQNQYDAHFGLNGTAAYDIVVRFTTRVNGENVVIDKNVRPELGDLIPVDIGGFIEVRDTVAIDSIEFPVSVLDEPQAVLPRSAMLYQNYPNPFNPVTRIEFALPEAGLTRLIIYDLQGREVAKLIDGEMSAGTHNITWDASKMASGIYIYRLTSGNFVNTKKMVLLK